jgi:DNA-binding winged helix-turn-helix (wHTH) protein
LLDARRPLELAWGDPLAGSTDQVRLYVSYLRRKLRGAPGVEPISTVRGSGYRYDSNQGDPAGADAWDRPNVHGRRRSSLKPSRRRADALFAYRTRHRSSPRRVCSQRGDAQ